MIHPTDEEALQTIDAAVFSGDPDIIRERLTYFMERWIKALAPEPEGHECPCGCGEVYYDPTDDALHDLRRAGRWPT